MADFLLTGSNQWLAANAIMVWQTSDNDSTMCNKYSEMKMKARSRDLAELILIEEALRKQSLLYRWLRDCNLRNHDLMIVWHFRNDLQQTIWIMQIWALGAHWRSKICWNPSFIGKEFGVCSVNGKLWGHMPPPCCQPIQSWRDSTGSFLSLLLVCTWKATSLQAESSCINWCHVSWTWSKSLQPLASTLEFPNRQYSHLTIRAQPTSF